MNEHSSPLWIVVTDLDGTLLDHHDYSFDAAKDALTKLKKLNIPVIINSSKTAKEIENIRLALGNNNPYIVENGSGILIPKQYFSFRPEGSIDAGEYWEVILGTPRDEILIKLKKLEQGFKGCYRSYSDSSVDDIMKATGLNETETQASMNRSYTEPLQWIGNQKQRELFYDSLRKHRIHFTEGGRFIHLMGHTNKGSATSWLSKQYAKEQQQDINILALGDGKNDIDMLKAADIAVVVKSPVNKAPEFTHTNKILTSKVGPEGWQESIDQLFNLPETTINSNKN